MSFAAADLADADGFVTTLTTSTSPVTLDGTDLNGVLVDDDNIGQPPKTGIAFWPTATASNTVGAFTTNAITFTGTYAGETVTRSAAYTSANGNQTVIADGPLETLVSISIPAMADTDGSHTFGFSGIGPRKDKLSNYKAWKVVSNADTANADTAAVHVAYSDGSTDTVELAKGAELLASPVRIYADSTAPVTIYE